MFSMFKLRQPIKELLPLVLTHTPETSSMKTFIHRAQEIKTCNLAKPCHRDYSEEKRLQKYVTNVSPKCHDMSQIMIPVSLHYADNVAQPLDVTGMYQRTLNRLDLFRENYIQFNHLNFLWSHDVKVFVNKQSDNLIFTKIDFKSMPKWPSIRVVFDPDFKELNAKLTTDVSKVKHALQKQWKKIQKKLPAWQNSISDRLGSLQGYIKRKLDKEKVREEPKEN